MAYKYPEYLTTALWGQGMFRKSSLEQINRYYNILNNQWLFEFETNKCKYQTRYWSDRVSHSECRSLPLAQELCCSVLGEARSHLIRVEYLMADIRWVIPLAALQMCLNWFWRFFCFPFVSCQQYGFQWMKSILWNSHRTSCYWTVVSFLMPCWTLTAWGICKSLIV